MLRLFMRKGPGFRQKNSGYGTGLPIAWQGWMLLALHIALIAGLAVLLQGRPVLMTIAIIAGRSRSSTAMPVISPICIASSIHPCHAIGRPAP